MPLWYKANQLFSLRALRGDQFIACRVLSVLWSSIPLSMNIKKTSIGNVLAAYQKMSFCPLGNGYFIMQTFLLSDSKK